MNKIIKRTTIITLLCTGILTSTIRSMDTTTILDANNKRIRSYPATIQQLPKKQRTNKQNTQVNNQHSFTEIEIEVAKVLAELPNIFTRIEVERTLVTKLPTPVINKAPTNATLIPIIKTCLWGYCPKQFLIHEGFYSYEDFYNHVKDHYDETTRNKNRIFSCKWDNNKCPFTTRIKSNLYQHLLQHTEKGFKCTYCDKTLARKRTLNTHINSHFGIKPFKCSQCDKTFAYKSSLSNHLKNACPAQNWKT